MTDHKSQAFAKEFELLYREIYARSVRRVRDKRHRLSPTTVGFLSHLAMTGPMTLSELSIHFDRAQSTLSEMVEHLCAKAYIERQREPNDGRRFLIWLTKEGQLALREAQTVLDLNQLASAGELLSQKDQTALISLLGALHSNLSKQSNNEEPNNG